MKRKSIFPKNLFFRKSVEEAGRSVEKTHRRLTTHINKTDTVTEEEETGSDSYEIDKHEQDLLPQRRFQRQSEWVFKTKFLFYFFMF
jgi:hypothetical protein